MKNFSYLIVKENEDVYSEITGNIYAKDIYDAQKVMSEMLPNYPQGSDGFLIIRETLNPNMTSNELYDFYHSDNIVRVSEIPPKTNGITFISDYDDGEFHHYAYLKDFEDLQALLYIMSQYKSCYVSLDGDYSVIKMEGRKCYNGF